MLIEILDLCFLIGLVLYSSNKVSRYIYIHYFSLTLQNVSIKTTVMGGAEKTLPQGKELMFKELNILTTC